MINHWQQRHQEVAREDLVMFINACLACTGQKEFYDDGYGQRVSLDFLHDYILGNYRLLYTRTLAAGINHFNQSQIILKLLATGKNTPPQHRTEEGALIAATLKQLPPQRAWGVLEEIRRRHINNRRSRAIARDYLNTRNNIEYEAVKYRRKVKAITIHSHLTLQGELAPFLFEGWQKKSYTTPIFEAFRAAHYSKEAIYQLPLTIAEGLANKENISREVFLNKIENKMTLTEKMRYQGVADRTKNLDIDLDFSKLPLTKLALYILSFAPPDRLEKREILEPALQKAARKALIKAPLKLNRVAAILDCSYSASGSQEKRRRPLGVALASHYLLKAAAKEYRDYWTIPVSDPFAIEARGQTDLATPLLAALEWGADLVIIISDGCENDPPKGAAEILRIYRTKLDPQCRTTIVHCNPVFNAEDFTLRPLSDIIPTVGLRDAEDLPTMLNFAQFAQGKATLSQLENYLAQRAQQMLEIN